TFSISNLGMYGVEDFAAVINPPEGAILAVGAVREEPVVKGGQIVPGKRMRMTLSCDHRVVDGAVGAQGLQVLRAMLESPAKILLRPPGHRRREGCRGAATASEAQRPASRQRLGVRRHRPAVRRVP